MVAASAVADLAAQALNETANQQPPPPLPPGWLLKESRSQPGVFYYYQQDTGVSTWDPPLQQGQELTLEEDLEQQTLMSTKQEEGEEEEAVKTTEPTTALVKTEADESANGDNNNSRNNNKRDREAVKTEDDQAETRESHHHGGNNNSNNKRQRKTTTPSQVRVLHILKKHKDSKRPASWRSHNRPITITKEQAREELDGLLEILREDADNPSNLIATFKELASQESDCSSAKRKGDLGMFGRKKMRPEFEEAAFGLDVDQLSGIVETASGVHILLRLE